MGASPLLVLSLSQRSARRLREQLTDLLDDPASLPEDVDEERVRSLVVGLTTAIHGWLEP